MKDIDIAGEMENVDLKGDLEVDKAIVPTKKRQSSEPESQGQQQIVEEGVQLKRSKIPHNAEDGAGQKPLPYGTSPSRTFPRRDPSFNMGTGDISSIALTRQSSSNVGRRRKKAAILLGKAATLEKIYYEDSAYSIKEEKSPANILNSFGIYEFPKHGLNYDVIDGRDTQHKLDIEELKSKLVDSYKTDGLIFFQGRKSIDKKNDVLRKENVAFTKLAGDTKQEALEKFERSLTLTLNGIDNIVKNLTQEHPKVPFAKKVDFDIRPNLDFITNLVNSGSPSKDVGNLIWKIEASKNPKQLLYQVANSDIATQKLLSGFFEKNKDFIDVENPDNNVTPFVFFKQAIKAELLLIGRQLITLEGVNDVLSRSSGKTVKNVRLLSYGSNSEPKKEMISYIIRKRSSKEVGGDNKRYVTAIEDVYNNSITTPILGAKFQYNKLLSEGVLDIASADPATRPNKLCGEGEILSEKQCDGWSLTSEAMENGTFDEVIMGLGTGKSNMKERILRQGNKELESLLIDLLKQIGDEPLEEFFSRKESEISQATERAVSPKPLSPAPTSKKRASLGSEELEKERLIFDIDLNSTPQDVGNIANIKKLQKAILEKDDKIITKIFPNFPKEKLKQAANARVTVLADEYHFAKKGQFRYRDNYKDDMSFAEGEKLKYDVISDFTADTGSFVVYGASGSVSKLEKESEVISQEIKREEDSLSNSQNRTLIRVANRFLYKINDEQLGNNVPAFKSVISKDKMLSNEWNLSAKFNQDVNGKSKRAEQKDVLVQGKNLSNKQYLIRTAFFLYQLANNFALDSVENLKEFKELKDALTPKSIGNNRKYDKDDALHTPLRNYPSENREGVKKIDEVLKDLLILGAEGNHRRKSSYKIDVTKLFDAVSNFYDSGLYKILPLENASQSISTGNVESKKPKLKKLKDQKEIKLSQISDIQGRLDGAMLKFEQTTLILDEKESSSNEEKSSSEEEKSSSEEGGLFKAISPHLTRIKGKKESLLLGGEKGQYIMPDFEINSQTCKDGDIKNIMNLAKVDILFLPHIDENGKMKCKMAHSAFGEIDYQILDLEQIDDQINAIKKIKNSQSIETTGYSPSILSIFDKSNSIGGDYKSASYGNMVLQLTHITDANFLVRDDAFTLQDFMQCDRNRTGKSGVDYDKMRLELIIPQDCVGVDLSESDSNQKMPTKLVEAVIDTTKKDEKVRLEAFEYYLDRYTSYNKTTTIDLDALKESSLQVSETINDGKEEKINEGKKAAKGKPEEKAVKMRLRPEVKSQILDSKNSDGNGLKERRDNVMPTKIQRTKTSSKVVDAKEAKPVKSKKTNASSKANKLLPDEKALNRKKIEESENKIVSNIPSAFTGEGDEDDEMQGAITGEAERRVTFWLQPHDLLEGESEIGVNSEIGVKVNDRESRIPIFDPQSQLKRTSIGSVKSKSLIPTLRRESNNPDIIDDDSGLKTPKRVSESYKVIQVDDAVSELTQTPESSTSRRLSKSSGVSEMSVRSTKSNKSKSGDSFIKAIYNIVEGSEDDSSEESNPSTSTKARERDILKDVKSGSNPFQSYRVTGKEDSYIEKSKVKEFFLVYKDVFDQESPMEDIASTMVAIIAKSASDNGLKLGELKRIMEIARISGDIINPLQDMPEDKALTPEEIKLLEDEKSHFRCFVSEVQDSFEQVGIYSIHISDNDERQGLSLPNLPSAIEDIILSIISELDDDVQSSELEQKVSDGYFEGEELLTIISGKIAKVDEKLEQELQETESRSRSDSGRS